MAIANSESERCSKLEGRSLKKAPALGLEIGVQQINAAVKPGWASWSVSFGIWICIWVLGVELGTSCILAAEDAPHVTSIPERPKRVYDEAKERYRKETNSVEVAWVFGRAAFDQADLATNDTQRAALAQEGIDACRRAIGLDPKSAPAHYYLGLNLGQLATTKLLGALKLVDQMEEVWKKTILLDPKFDYAGAHRTIGILYRDAPGWPTSLGSRSKARHHLQKAVELCPEYPGNRLSLFEAYAKWGEKKAVQSQAAATEEFLKKARQQFTGEAWALDWRDWEKRWEKIKSKCGVVPARSPRDAQ